MTLNHANRVTIVRILLIVPFVICMLKVNDPAIGTKMRYISLLLFMIMAFSDAYDGYVARKKKQVTRLGSFLDPMADKLLMACACILLSVQKTRIDGFGLPPAVAVLIIGKDFFLLIGFLILYFMTFQVKIVPIFVGRLATILQLTMVAAILIAPEASALISGWLWFLRFLWWSASVTAIITTLVYIHSGTRYIEQFENSK
ncbi:MAG: CDP-alcohol phosphatidyltransferase family protein [Planctomycetes bacterium]|nr:CDP-alcohol phosphatidyltransferase family protein [Planctomycetota bacterium]MBU1517829.1 CDP-alcohol phosphatidyltransferase family protein [Planctomycetota bacterium]MBU2458284.1 CDP-alcohol phosphatidyltransferase family protein [Planctomycetota bacterium]MBU2596722.1 CDP-alcohol phosphatidyltransferase family protein [Planctomycetota bacterium]